MHVLELDGSFSDLRMILLVSRLEELHPDHCRRFHGALHHLRGKQVVVRPDAEHWLRVIDQEVRKRRLAHHVQEKILGRWSPKDDHCDHMRALAAVTRFHLKQHAIARSRAR